MCFHICCMTLINWTQKELYSRCRQGFFLFFSFFKSLLLTGLATASTYVQDTLLLYKIAYINYPSIEQVTMNTEQNKPSVCHWKSPGNKGDDKGDDSVPTQKIYHQKWLCISVLCICFQSISCTVQLPWFLIVWFRCVSFYD